MKIKFLGAASGVVTGSSYVLTSGSGKAILIDLGMFQGLPEVDKLNYEPFDCDPKNFDGVVLTHAHLDHCGRLPILLPKGFTGNIWMTPATRDLTELSLFDTAKIAKNDGKPILFDEDLVAQTVARFKTVDYHTPFQIGDFTLTMVNAGHILGSVSLLIEDNNSNSEIKTIVFSGDLGNSPEPLQKVTETFDSADAVVMESTYGDRLHPAGDAASDVQAEINNIEASGGTLLIPSFSLERTQEILHIIMHLKKEGKVQAQTPIYLDSPMAEKATVIYTHYPNEFNSHIAGEFKVGNPFEFPGLNIINDGRHSGDLDRESLPKVIIAGGGMMTGGRILSHAAHYLPMTSTRLFIVGYQGEGTLGREILEGGKEVTIEGVKVEIKAVVNSTLGMSSHADENQLVSWLTKINNVKKVIITHGENSSRETLARKITTDLRIKDVVLPELNQEIGV